jgi:hypothetical protein
MPCSSIPLVLALSVCLAAAGQPAGKNLSRPANPPKPRPERGPGGGPPAPRRQTDVQIEKLQKMTPGERQKALASLPPERRARIETRLENLQKLTPEQKAKLQDRLEKLRSLTPDQQKRVRQAGQKLQVLPDDRKPIVRRELQTLQNMPDDQRNARMNSPAFQQKFSPDEQKILRDSSLLYGQL